MRERRLNAKSAAVCIATAATTLAVLLWAQIVKITAGMAQRINT
jgi:hypothetical protein